MEGMRKLGAVLLLMGCGDPRAPFVGSYSGTEKWTYTDTNRVNSDSTDFFVDAPERSDRVTLRIPGYCTLSAKLIDAESLQFDAVSCPPKEGTSVSGVKATYTDSYSTGSGTLTNKTLTLGFFGNQLASNFADGRPNATLPFKVEITATRP